MNNSVAKKAWICGAIMLFLLVADQIVKIWIKTTFPIGGEVSLIGDWCRLHFVENEGMAFGFSFGGVIGKYFLTAFRLIASVFIMYFLVKQIKKDNRWLLVISISLIFVGAVGNVIDCCLYGLVFTESTFDQVAAFVPFGNGYGRFMLGKVVDMFYFPICEWTWPSWVPVIGGGEAEFFNAIFNVADSSICVGVALLFIDQCFFTTGSKNKKTEEETVAEEGEKEE